MVGWPGHPIIYEISTWVWLDEQSRAQGSHIGLGEVPDAEWDRIAELAVDAVWLMGVWERSPAGTEVARADAALRDRAAELGFDPAAEDTIVGSPYCIRRYVPDLHLGGWAGLDGARQQLAKRGVKLLLDYVPNHVAPDHPWLTDHPEYLIPGTDVGGVFAFGRELQSSPPWSDVVQINAFHPGLRAASVETLSTIAQHCDGVRCDMAMLALNDIFARCWGERAGPVPDAEYWTELIGGVRAGHPDFVFLAEAYWDCEWRLMQQGFDFCYDKVLCDRLIHGDGSSIGAHLVADLSFQRHLVRFLENHDEDRAAAVMPPDHSRAAAVAIATLPGATLVYEGQCQGLRTRLPVALGRRPRETPDEALQAFYRALLPAAQELRAGEWSRGAATGWPDNDSCRHIATWSWHTVGATFLVAINCSETPSQAQVHFSLPDACRGDVEMIDPVAGEAYVRNAEEIRDRGLYVDLSGHRFHLLRVRHDED